MAFLHRQTVSKNVQFRFPGKFGEVRTSINLLEPATNHHQRARESQTSRRDRRYESCFPMMWLFSFLEKESHEANAKNGRRSSARARLRMGGVGAGRGGARRRRGTQIAIPLTRGRCIIASRGEARETSRRETSVARRKRRFNLRALRTTSTYSPSSSRATPLFPNDDEDDDDE